VHPPIKCFYLPGILPATLLKEPKYQLVGHLRPNEFYFSDPEKIISAKFLYLLNSITFAFPKFLG